MLFSSAQIQKEPIRFGHKSHLHLIPDYIRQPSEQRYKPTPYDFIHLSREYHIHTRKPTFKPRRTPARISAGYGRARLAPWDWRHRNNKTVILGAFSVPINAQSLLLPRSASEGAPSPDCVIKGNISRSGERIYHLPNQIFYARIRMDKGGGRRWFCTPEEAEAAGWRRALR